MPYLGKDQVTGVIVFEVELGYNPHTEHSQSQSSTPKPSLTTAEFFFSSRSRRDMAAYQQASRHRQMNQQPREGGVDGSPDRMNVVDAAVCVDIHQVETEADDKSPDGTQELQIQAASCWRSALVSTLLNPCEQVKNCLHTQQGSHK